MAQDALPKCLRVLCGILSKRTRVVAEINGIGKRPDESNLLWGAQRECPVVILEQNDTFVRGLQGNVLMAGDNRERINVLRDIGILKEAKVPFDAQNLADMGLKRLEGYSPVGDKGFGDLLLSALSTVCYVWLPTLILLSKSKS
jgi:hypothetical protein